MKSLKSRFILNCICLFCWVFCSVISFANDSPWFLKFIYTFNAIIWTINVYVTGKQYRNENKS